MEGIGYDFVPSGLDQSAPNLWIKITDQDSFQFARQFVQEEGLLCGGSSGATIVAFAQRVELISEDKVIVVLLPDGLHNYLTKFANEDWMPEQGYEVRKTSISNEQWIGIVLKLK